MSVEKETSMLVFPPGLCNNNPYRGIALMLHNIMDHIRKNSSGGSGGGGNQHAELLNPPLVVDFCDDSAGTLRDPSVRHFEWTALIHDTTALLTELKEKINLELFYAWPGMASPRCAIVKEYYDRFDPQANYNLKATYFLTLNDEDVDDGVVWHDIQDRLFAWVSGNLDRQSVYVVPASNRNMHLYGREDPTHPYKLCANAKGQKSSFFCESNPMSSLGSASKKARLGGGALMDDDVAHNELVDNELAAKETKKAKVLRWWAEAPPLIRDLGFDRIARNEGPEVAEKCRLAVEIHRKRLAAAS